jgi:hypothetical protein
MPGQSLRHAIIAEWSSVDVLIETAALNTPVSLI